MRHWQDAGYLSLGKRLANADQLYGLAAECALKYAMVILGAPTESTGDLKERSHRQHIDELWSEYETFATGRRGSRFLSPLSRFGENPFADWKIESRYAADSEAPGGAVWTFIARPAGPVSRSSIVSESCDERRSSTSLR